MSTPTDFAALARRLLGDIAPDVDTGTLGPDDDIRELLDIDSVDFLNFVEAIHHETGVEIAERDYPQVSTLAGISTYLASRVAS